VRIKNTMWMQNFNLGDFNLRIGTPKYCYEEGGGNFDGIIFPKCHKKNEESKHLINWCEVP
jgi:hypothetical protein